jgi:PST family polysaccharide transporter
MVALRSGRVRIGQRALVAEPPTDVASHEIGRSLRRGAVWAIGSQLAVQGVRLVGVVILARLLTPADYGTAALAVTLASFSTTLGDFCFGTALVQAETASQRWASTAYWAALAAGTVGFGLAALAAYPAALALGEPEVAPLLIAGGLTLVLVAAGSASNAFLTRSMSFGVIQGTMAVATVIAMACAIAAASIGLGAWALVLQQLVLAATTSAVFIVAARWRPSLEFSRTAFRSLARFAMPLTGAAVLWAFQALLTGLLVGSLVSIDALGIWNFAMAIVVLPAVLVSAPLARVIYAAFARMRDERERVAEVWLSGLTLLAGVVLPLLVILIALAPDLIPIAFGAQWTPAVPVVQILAVFFMCRGLQMWNTSVMDAAGKPHVGMILNALVLISLPPSVWLGSHFGVAGVAVAYSLASLAFGEIPSFVLTTRELGVTQLSVLRRLREIALSAVTAGAAVACLRRVMEAGGIALEPRVALSLAFGAATYVCTLRLIAPGVAHRLLGMVRGLGPALRPQT